MPIFCQQNIHSPKNTMLPCLYFVQKHPNIHLLINTVLLCRFFKVFMKNPILPCPYYVKNVNYVKTTLYLGSKKLIKCLVFLFLTKNITYISIFCPRKSILKKKTRYSHAHILSKKLQFSQKQPPLISSFLNFS